MQIQNAAVWHDGAFSRRDIAIAGDRFAPPDCQEAEMAVDANGLYAIPGMIDLHLHGCGGADFSAGRPGDLATMARFLADRGITGFCPATLAMPEAGLDTVCRTAAAFAACPQESELLGVYLEAPFLSPAKAGAHRPEHLSPPDRALFDRLQQAAGGKIRLITIAPELPDAKDLIAGLSPSVLCALGHTEADYDTASAAFAAGAGLVTHLFNTMPPLTAREPGVIGAALDSDCYVELICDGVHVHPANVRAAFRLFGAHRVILVSDCMSATGLGDGAYHLGGLPVTVSGRQARVTATGTLAGSVTHLADCLRTAVAMGVPLADAIGCVTENPARALGRWPERGCITPGAVADLVLLDSTLKLRQVFLRGRPLFPDLSVKEDT